jgi:hypothetical protein
MIITRLAVVTEGMLDGRFHGMRGFWAEDEAFKGDRGAWGGSNQLRSAQLVESIITRVSG